MPEAGGKASSSPLLGGAAEPTLAMLSEPGRRASSTPALDVPRRKVELPEKAEPPSGLPEVSEHDLVMHVNRLAHRNYAVDLGAYPLGSCTMKYNPKVCDYAAEHTGFKTMHPAAPAAFTQGVLAVLLEAEAALCELTGMSRATFQPPAGAAGELTGLLIMRAHHAAKGDARSKVIIPDTAHGTNPASVTLSGMEAVVVRSNERGMVDIAALRAAIDDQVAGLMLTNPNTLGIFEQEITTTADLVHEAGGLVYYDGANLNAVLGVVRPGDMGFDIVHSNLHKTFATPHGGGGPGAGPVAVKEELVQYLPGPLPARLADGSLGWQMPAQSIGRVHAYHGNFLVVLRALTYMKALGGNGLRLTGERAVLNARYLASLVADILPTPYDAPCMHEFVATAAAFKKGYGVRAMDLAKGLLDSGFHAPTMYFPLIVEEALMFEPTETQSKQTLEALAEALHDLADLAAKAPDELHKAPTITPVGRPDEATAARQLDLQWAH